MLGGFIVNCHGDVKGWGRGELEMRALTLMEGRYLALYAADIKQVQKCTENDLKYVLESFLCPA